MPHHVVVDGSNLATEGRTAPSLKQLNEAVLAYMADDPEALITVVVDATFGHRIDPKEVAEFDDAVSNNELVAPPAGAIGRGDAFVLSIAHKVNADILTNDSYQEFHAQYDWLFDEGRLIGGKPVPHIGWVFVKRLPVRGPMSRKVTSEAKRKGSAAGAGGSSGGRGRGRSSVDDGTVRVGSPEANLPMPIPKSPPPRAAAKVEVAAEAPVKASRSRGGRGRGGDNIERVPKTPAAVEAPAAAVGASSGGPSSVNDLLSFLTFVERHPAGTSVNAIVDHYSSHGAYVRIGEMVGYVPLRLMAEPAPRSAREFMKVGESVTLVVESFVPTKRSVDLAIPGMGSAKQLGEAAPAKAAKVRKPAAATKRAAKATIAPEAPAEPVATPKPARGSAKRSATPVVSSPASHGSTSAAVTKPAKPAKSAPTAKAVAKKSTATSPAKVALIATPPSTTTAPAGAVAAAPTKKAAAAKKAAPAKKAAATNTAPLKKAAPVKKLATATVVRAAPAAPAAPAKKAATKKAAAGVDPVAPPAARRGRSKA